MKKYLLMIAMLATTLCSLFVLSSCDDDSENGLSSVTASAEVESYHSAILNGFAYGANGKIGFCYSSTIADPTPDNSTCVETSTIKTDGSYSIRIDGLKANTTYYYRAYATKDNIKIMAKEVMTFMTKEMKYVTSITLSETSLTLNLDETYKLSATISPAKADNPTLTWSSGNPDVATVSTTGLVTAKAVGSATVTCSATDGSGAVATCEVTVQKLYEYVDLGLSVKWATCNVGADNSEDYGDYYAWGETETKDTYNWSTYKWCNGSKSTMTKYCTSSSYGKVDNKTTLDPEDDVAHVKWGGDWRMPTKAEQDELRNTNNCTWKWTTQGGKYGTRVTSKINGNSIFLPASGYRGGSDLHTAGSSGYFWFSSLDTSNSCNAYNLGFNSSEGGWGNSSRYFGLSVRPVCPSSSFVRVTSITLNKSSMEMTEGGTYQLSATISPSNATNKNLTWSSSNSDVATVSTTGLVTAKAVGSATITATAADGSGKMSTCAVTVKSNVVSVTSITLDKSSVEMTKGGTYQLSATISPSNATNKNVTWSSSNSNVATVSTTGLVTAKAVGSATITATAADGSGKMSTCAVTVKSYVNNGHEYVDLGLPSGIKWATCNVGADNPEDYGDCYAWGETETRRSYSWPTYKWCKGSEDTMTKYCTSSSYGTVDNKSTLDPEDDVAHVKWGGTWRMPTRAELDELRNSSNCTWTWTTQGGKKGYLVTSKKNGNSIFLPAAGYRRGNLLDAAGYDGNYWSSSLSTSYPYNAYYLYFYSSSVLGKDYNRKYGRSVRPVCQ